MGTRMSLFLNEFITDEMADTSVFSDRKILDVQETDVYPRGTQDGTLLEENVLQMDSNQVTYDRQTRVEDTCNKPVTASLPEENDVLVVDDMEEVLYDRTTEEDVQESTDAQSSEHSDSGDDEAQNKKETFLLVKLGKAREDLGSNDFNILKRASEEIDMACRCLDSIIESGGIGTVAIKLEIVNLLAGIFKKQLVGAQNAWNCNELQVAAEWAGAAEKTSLCLAQHFPAIPSLHYGLQEDFRTLNELQVDIAEKRGILLLAVKHLYHACGIDQVSPSSPRQRVVVLLQAMILEYDLGTPRFKNDMKELVLWQENEGMALLIINPLASHYMFVDCYNILKRCPDLLDREKRDQLMCHLCFMLATCHLACYKVDPQGRLELVISYSREALQNHSSYDYKPALFMWTCALKEKGNFHAALAKARKYHETKWSPKMTPETALLVDACDMEIDCIISELEALVPQREPSESSQPDPDWIDMEYHQTKLQKSKQLAEEKKSKHINRKRTTYRRHSESSQPDKSRDLSTPYVNTGAATPNDSTRSKKSAEQRTAPAFPGTSVSSVVESIQQAVVKGRSTASSLPGISRKTRKKEDADRLQCIFPTDSWYEESKRVLNEAKSNFVSDLLQDQEVQIDDKFCPWPTKNVDQKKKEFYTQRSRGELQALLKSNPQEHKLCTMRIQSSQKAHCRLVEPEDDLETIEINGKTRCGQAFTKDEVVVKILQAETRNDATIGEVLGVLNKHSKARHPVFICEADAICPDNLMKPQCRTVAKVRVLRPRKEQRPSEGNAAKFDIPIYSLKNGRMIFIRWISLLRSDCSKCLYWVVYSHWPDNNLFPSGYVVKITDLQNCSEEVKMDMLLSGATVQHKLKVLYDGKTLERTWRLLDKTPHNICISEELMKGRENLTEKLKVFTIDPTGSKDFDDALSLQVNSDGSLSVGIHITDVSAFVRKGDEIDQEAQKRGTSHYPPAKGPIHMLPEPLSAERLSLVPGQNRLALSVFLTFLADGKLVEERQCKILKTVIRSRKQYTYEKVQDIIEARESHKDVSTLEGKIVQLHVISMKLRKKRLGNGCYHQSFDWLEDDLPSWEAHCLIEELMILTNKEVASFLLKNYPRCTPLRCQKAPSDEQIEKFQNHFSSEFTDVVSFLQQFSCFGKRDMSAAPGLSITAFSHIPILKWVWQLLLDAIESKDSRSVATLLHLECFHPAHALAMYEWIAIQMPAEYRCSSDDDLANLKHFALGDVLYTQFTSPIRRYLDIIVHRLVHSALNGTGPEYKPYEIGNICDSVNEMQSVAKSYDKHCKSLKSALKLQKQPVTVPGIIVSVTDEKVELLNPLAIQTRGKIFDLNFSKLGVFAQPQLDNPEDPSEGVTLFWKKRLYDARGTHPHAKPSVKQNTRRGISSPMVVPRLDPSNIVAQISLEDWKKLKCFNIKSKGKQQLGKIDPRPPADYTVSDVTSEVRDGELVEQYCNFSLHLKRGQCVSVQLSASQTNCLLEPEIQLCTIAPSVTLCLLHMTDPVTMFTEPARCAAKSAYKSVKEYRKIWKPIMDMEIAANIIKAPEETIVINNQEVTLFKSANHGETSGSARYSGHLKLGRRFCDTRCIVLEEEGSGEFVTDYLCLRYTPTSREASSPLSMNQVIQQKMRAQATWIAHGQVQNVSSGESECCLNFELNHVTQQPAEELFSKSGVACTIELLHKGPGERRIEEALSDLEEGSLAASLAKGYKPVPSQEMKRQLQIINKMRPWMQQKIREMAQSGFDLSMWEVQSKDTGFHGNNNTQREAIEKAIKSEFSIIHGPPGTGKTFTAIKLVYFFVLINKFTQMTDSKDDHKARLRQVLFCGPSNKSVDVVAECLKEKFRAKRPRIVRVYGETIEAKEFPKPTKWVSKVASCRAVCDQELKDIALHHIIRRPDRPYSAEIRQYDNLIKSSPKEAWKKRKAISKLLFKAGLEELKNCEVVLCTATTSSSPKVVQGTNVFQCIVDECGMCPEPECLVPLVSSKAKQVVLIGDHKQLQPIITCKDAAGLGLQKSLFERYAEALENQPPGTGANYTMLNIQYRMHPSICDFPSKTFYDDKLVTGLSSSSKQDCSLPIWPGGYGQYNVTAGGTVRRQAQVVFCDVEGKEETLQVSTSEGNENSKSNKVECGHVVRIVNALVQQFGVEPRHINVMSQYNAQCSELTRRLKHYRELNLNTVVTSQGGEWDYVVFSLVRSLPPYLIDPHPTMGWCQQNLGFITDEHQVNVALTRAKKGLILIGNRNLLQCHGVWETLFQNYSKLGCVVFARDFLPPAALGRQVSQPVGAEFGPGRQISRPGPPSTPLQPLWNNPASSSPYRM